MKTLQEQREELENRLKRLEDTHAKKGLWTNESTYQASCKTIAEVYKELSEVAQELGDSVPVRF